MRIRQKIAPAIHMVLRCASVMPPKLIRPPVSKKRITEKETNSHTVCKVLSSTFFVPIAKACKKVIKALSKMTKQKLSTGG